MAMNLSAASDVLKVFYLPPVREMLNNATILLSRIEKDSSTQDVSGTSFTVPLHKSRNEAAGVGRGDGGALPTAGQQGYAKAVVPNKYVYGRIQVTGPVIAATKNSAGAFIKAIESEMKGLMRDTKRAVNRQLHGDGIDALAYYVSGTGSTSGTVDDDLGNGFTHLPAGTAVNVDLLDASSSYSVLQSTTITAGAISAASVAVTTGANISGSAADGDPWVVTGTKDYQMMGIKGIIDSVDPPLLTGGLHGLTVASNPWWTAQVVGSDSSPVDISFPLLQQVFTAIATNSDYSEADIKFLLTSYQIRDKYVELCTNERRFYNVMKLDGGFEAVDYNGKPLVPDSQCRRQRIYFIVPETLKLFRSADFDWMDKDGSVFSRVSGYDAYEAVLFHYGDLGCIARNGNGVLKGIND
jgi:hypothetical protein